MLPLVVVGGLVGFGLGDLNEVAEDVVEFDFQGVDAGAFPLGLLHFGNPLLATSGGISEFVEGFRVAVSDDATVAKLCRRFLDQGILEGFDQGREFLDGIEKLGMKARGFGYCRQVCLEIGDAFEGNLKGFQVAGIAGALRESAGGALDVADVFERFVEFGEEVGFGEEGIDEVEAGGELVELAEGMQDPVAEFASAHRGGGAVENAEKGVLLAGA